MSKKIVVIICWIFCCLAIIFSMVGCSSYRNLMTNLGDSITTNTSLSINDVKAVVLETAYPSDNGEACLVIAIEGEKYRLKCNRSFALTCESLHLGQSILIKSPTFPEVKNITAENIIPR